MSPFTDALSKNVFATLSTVTNTLEKFNIRVSHNLVGTTFYINNIEYDYALDTTCFRRNYINECIDGFGCYERMTLSKFNIKDLDLLNPSSIQNKIITY